jgi:ssDNA-binding Zn-finger/Zn-ribbon topoisomerase 1
MGYDIWCKSCGCVMKRREGKFGPFYGCTGYPNCKSTRSVKDAQLEDEAPEDIYVREDWND